MKATIAKAVRSHLFFSISEFDTEEEATLIEMQSGQLAIAIYTELLGEEHLSDLTATELRAFLADCGIAREVAQRIVSDDDQPLAIY